MPRSALSASGQNFYMGIRLKAVPYFFLSRNTIFKNCMMIFVDFVRAHLHSSYYIICKIDLRVFLFRYLDFHGYLCYNMIWVYFLTNKLS